MVNKPKLTLEQRVANLKMSQAKYYLKNKKTRNDARRAYRAKKALLPPTALSSKF
jgi:hypothetical protein